MSDLRRRLRGTIKNAAVWGVGWTLVGFTTTLALRMTGIVDAPVSLPDALVLGLKIGVGGAIAGTAFSAFIAFAYRNRRIRDINWLTFGVGGAVVTAASITGFVQGASLLGGSGLVSWRYMNPTLAMFAVFGFGAAAISMRLAQQATARVSDRDEVVLDDEKSAQLTSDSGTAPSRPRAHARVDARRD